MDCVFYSIYRGCIFMDQQSFHVVFVVVGVVIVIVVFVVLNPVLVAVPLDVLVVVYSFFLNCHFCSSKVSDTHENTISLLKATLQLTHIQSHIDMNISSSFFLFVFLLRDGSHTRESISRDVKTEFVFPKAFL